MACTCGHEYDEHNGGVYCLVELDDGSDCECLQYESSDDKDGTDPL